MGPSFLPDERAVAKWVLERFPFQRSLHWRITKHTEEAGEVAGAYVKMNDGTGRKTAADLRQECAQAYICLLGIAGAAGFRLDDAVAEEWERCNG